MTPGPDDPTRRPALAAVPTPAEPGAAVSVWCGRPGREPLYTRNPDHGHYAASLMKLAVALALDEAVEAGRIAPTARAVVTDTFTSRVGGRFVLDRGSDNDDEPWHRRGEEVELSWLARRMLIASSNLVTCLLVERLGLAAVDAQCPRGAGVGRHIGDVAAQTAGHTNTITAAAAAALLAKVLERRRVGGTGATICALRGSLHRDGIPAGLDEPALVGNKAGWVDGVRHDCAIIEAPDRACYVLSVCTTGLDDQDASAFIRSVARASWHDTSPPGRKSRAEDTP